MEGRNKRQKREQETTVHSPPKPPSPDDENEDDERLYWFKYVEQALQKQGRTASLRDDVTEDDLDMNNTQRKRAQKSDSSKRNFFVRDAVSGDILMIKLHTNVERSYKEWFINCKLKEFNVPHIIPALAWCKGRQTPKGFECAFLVLPFIKSVPLQQVATNPEEGDILSDLQLLEGLKQILEVLAATDPEMVGTAHIKLWHKDLNEGQVLYAATTNSWYLIDFGLSEITYTGSLQPASEEIRAEISIRASSSFSNSSSELNTLINMFVARLQSVTIKQRFLSTVTRNRNTWLQMVTNQIQSLPPLNPVSSTDALPETTTTTITTTSTTTINP